MKTRSTFRRTIFISTFALASTQAAVLWTNPITGADPGTFNPYTTGQTVIPNTTVSGIGRGAGVAGNVGDNRYNANSWNTPTIDLTAYFSFTLSPDSGFEINFENFIYTGQASATGPTAFAFRSSADGFISNIGGPTAVGTTISLAPAAYQGIDTPIEFRLYAWGASGSTGTFSVNDFTFNGDVVAAIPEPSTFMLGAIGVLALFRRRR